MHWGTFKQASYSIVGEDGGCWVSEVRAGVSENLEGVNIILHRHYFPHAQP